MRFSKKKKRKIRRTIQKRRIKESKHIIGCCLDDGYSEVIDKLIVNGDVYLLVQANDGYYICRFVNYEDTPRISLKRICKNKKSFHGTWCSGTEVDIDDYGTISVC